MKLNHVHLTVDDVPAARQLLERHFGLRPVGEGHKNFDMLLDDDGLALTLIGAGRDNTVSYPNTFHIGFIQPPTRTSMRSTSASKTTVSTPKHPADSAAPGVSPSKLRAASGLSCAQSPPSRTASHQQGATASREHMRGRHGTTHS